MPDPVQARFWNRFWQMLALLVSAAAVGIEWLDWSGYVPSRLRRID